MVRHCKEDSLEEEEFERLVSACEETTHPEQNRFLVLVMGRLGLRAAEVAHMEEHWISENNKLIEIPEHEPCNCSSCKAQARQRSEVNGIPYEEALEMQWKAKTENSARPVPYNLEDRIVKTVEEIIDEYGGCPVKRYRINKRIDKVAETAGLDPLDVYPHALRATAAFNLAYQEVTPYQLMNWMGWNQLNTAMNYIRASGRMVKSAVEDIKNRR